jgi:hypothetical protein
MRNIPNILVRPLEKKDLSLLKRWRHSSEWPQKARSILNDYELKQCMFVSGSEQDIILIAEPSGKEPIGLAHLSVSGLPTGIAQYSLAIPEPKQRLFGRSYDLFLLSVGAAFFVYKLKQMFCMISSDRDWLVSTTLKSGFSKKNNFLFLGCKTPVESNVRILTITPNEWAPIWGTKFILKARNVPWLNANLDWKELYELCEETDRYSSFKRKSNQHGHSFCPNEMFVTVNSAKRIIPPIKVIG